MLPTSCTIAYMNLSIPLAAAAVGGRRSRCRQVEASNRGGLTCAHSVPPGRTRLLAPKPTVPKAVSQTDAVSSHSKVELSVWDVSALAVSIYPTFSYDAVGAGGPGEVLSRDGSVLHVQFDMAQFSVPPLNDRTAKVLNIPIPPPLQIDVRAQSLEGTVEMETGRTSLAFVSEFCFSVGEVYKAAPLLVETTLTSEISKGRLFVAEGKRLADGKARLVGVATVPRTTDWLLNTFLMLPTEALAVLPISLAFG